MTKLSFSKAGVGDCHITIAEPNLPPSIKESIDKLSEVRYKEYNLDFIPENSDIVDLSSQPVFFEWQQIDWFFEPDKEQKQYLAPYKLYVNGNYESNVQSHVIQGAHRLVGSLNLKNSVGYTDFVIKDNSGKVVFELNTEVFPQKLEYKDDFSEMMSEITEILYDLAFDVFKKTYAFAAPKSTYHQNLSEWMNIYRVLAESFEASIDVILRNPKSIVAAEKRIRLISKVKKADRHALRRVAQAPHRYCRGGGVEIAGMKISHLQDQHKEVNYDIKENRFVAWAIKQVIRKIDTVISGLSSMTGSAAAAADETRAVLEKYRRRLRFRLNDKYLSDVSDFNNQLYFSTTLTMAPGYKEFYYRFLLLRKGLSLAEDSIFKMDYKDIATLYEYWCFLKTIKLLKENPNYELESTDIIKTEHQRFVVGLRKGKESCVNLLQKSTGDEVSIYYNRGFKTSTYMQIPDNFIEFSRRGYDGNRKKKNFKYILDAKYRFDRGSPDYPSDSDKFGPPQDAIGQLHRYRDALLWDEDKEHSLKVANKVIGGLILFPYPNDESAFEKHTYYQSINKVNIGAIPLQPGEQRNNRLYNSFLNQLFDSTAERINESVIHYDARTYRARQSDLKTTVLVGLVPENHSDARWSYHKDKKCFYTQWAKSSQFPYEEVKIIALYDKSKKSILAYAGVTSIELMRGDELHNTGTDWSPRAPDAIHLVYRLDKITDCDLQCASHMQGKRHGRFFTNKLALELACSENNDELLSMRNWDEYLYWKSRRYRH